MSAFPLDERRHQAYGDNLDGVAGGNIIRPRNDIPDGDCRNAVRRLTLIAVTSSRSISEEGNVAIFEATLTEERSRETHGSSWTASACVGFWPRGTEAGQARPLGRLASVIPFRRERRWSVAMTLLPRLVPLSSEAPHSCQPKSWCP